MIGTVGTTSTLHRTRLVPSGVEVPGTPIKGAPAPAAADTPSRAPIDATRVTAVRALINSNAYRIDAAAIAERMITTDLERDA